MYCLIDTITAVASPPGGAARGIVRLSGPTARDCAAACFQPREGSTLAALGATTDLSSSADGVPSPRAIAGIVTLDGFSSPLPCEAYFWSEGRSYTGQAMVEFHTFGSPPLLEALVQTLCALGARPARPGEFTLRAFLSGRIDLTQAEAVLGAIDAAGDRDFEAALRQLAGGFSGPLRQLRQQLLELLARLEAGFDFTDEDIACITPDELRTQIQAAGKQVSEMLDRLAGRTVSEPAVRIVFVGRPNVGKSSLFNAMIRRTGAIVSPRPGTTRDYLAAEGSLGGAPCVWIDTAGIQVEEILLEKEPGSADASAQDAARRQHETATLSLLCLEAGRLPDVWEQKTLARLAGLPHLVVLTKVDQRPRGVPPQSRSGVPPHSDSTETQSGKMPLLIADALPTSSLTGEGIEELRAALSRLLRNPAASEADAAPCTAARCRQSLLRAAASLRRAAELARKTVPIIAQQKEEYPPLSEELIALEIRSALEELGRVVGTVYTEDILDRIFSRFCIGK
ncbi:MAG: 50S ribosome-binding GTPase [Pirellulales bacterium]|nr:50S ribosome-binding GTPase [Pirellulales bacterium]